MGLTTDKHGRHKIQFTLPDGSRDGFRLGRMPKRAAEEIDRHVQNILTSRRSGARLPDGTADWLGRACPRLRTQLLRSGVIDPSMVRPEHQVWSLRAFLDHFIEASAHKKPSTQRQLGLTRKYLLMCFDGDRDLASITPAEADDFRVWLGKSIPKKKKALADNTVRRQCGRAQQVFRNAVRRRLIAENPFADMRNIQVVGNPERNAEIDMPTCERVLAACPDWEWRLIFALARFGGLRVPSEIADLRWRDVDWNLARIRLRVPKLEHIPGRATREVPIFPELHPHLEAAWNASDRDAEFVVRTPHYRDPKANLRTPLLRILKAAGVTPWPKLLQNLRANRYTELAAIYPEWKVNRWLGNTQAVGREHYLQMRDADFLEASGGPDRPAAVPGPWLKNGSADPRTGEKWSATEQPSRRPGATISRESRDPRAQPAILNNRPVPRLGLEPRTL